MFTKAGELKPVFDEIAKRTAGMSDRERRAWIDNALGDPAVALDILNSCAERILGRPVEEGTVITWPAELVEAVPGFVVQLLEGEGGRGKKNV